jgi:DNA gyrase subunit B
MIKKNNTYDNTSITSLKGADRVRLRPSVVFGSDDLTGCQHSFFEILANSIDEAREGYGKIINIRKYRDGSLEVEDFGRGIPLDYNETEKKFNWKLIYCELYAGGKYNNNSGENYEYSLGLNGLGTCAAQYASRWFDVVVYRDEQRFELHFEKGSNRGGLKKEAAKDHYTGTLQRWLPDDEVFTSIDIPLEYFQETLKRQSIVNPGIEFNLFDEETDGKYRFFYQNGIEDYISETVMEDSFTKLKSFSFATKGRDRKDKPEYKLKFQISFCFSRNKNLLEYYHNSSFLEYGGSPDKAIRQAFVFAIDKLIKNKDKYKKNESKVTFADVQDALVLISSSFSTLTSYENQTKKAISNIFIYESMLEYLKDHLEVYFIENNDEADRIIEQMLVNKRSRETAENTRLNIRKKLNGNLDITNRVEKFVDCRTKDTALRELYIVEGDSALGSCKMARDANFQAVMPVRGKILNCLKADLEKVFKNDIIVDLLKVLGCGVELRSGNQKKLDSFDMGSFRWDKVIICTDADVDGFHIRTQILAMLYKLVPSVIKEGKVYIAETPLYEINTGKDTFFAYSETEKTQILSHVKGKYSIQRSKGLGENEPEMMWLTTMSPDTRRLIRVNVVNGPETDGFFELFLGDNLSGRKSFIENNGDKYIQLMDIS